MKKILAVILAALTLAFGAFIFAACDDASDKTPSGGGAQDVEVEVYLPDGTPALALAKVITEGVEIEGYSANFHIIAAADIGKVFASTDADLAIMPTIGAATNYNNGMGIQLVSTNVFGNLFIVGVNGTADSFADLKGKTVMTTAATTIELFQYLLNANDIKNVVCAPDGTPDADTVYLVSYDGGNQIIQNLKLAETNKTEAYGVLGEPQVTMCQTNVPSASIAIDFQAEWKTLTSYEGYPQASLIARNTFVSEHVDFVEAFATALEDNGTWLAQESNIQAFQNALKEYNETADYQTTLAGAKLTVDTVKRCNLDFQMASEVKASVIDYIGRLNSAITLQDNFFFTAA